MTEYSRRTFLQAGATALSAVALTALPRPLFADLGRGLEVVPPIQDPRIKELALRGVEAARAAGAGYADVRLTHTYGLIAVEESMTVGVRALVNGYWGFASSPVWSPDELARLGREAVLQAKANSLGGKREVELAPVPVVADGHWVRPVEVDPFTLSPYEIEDVVTSLKMYASRIPGVELDLPLYFERQEKAFASSLGSYYTQQTGWIVASGNKIKLNWAEKRKQGTTTLECLTPAGLGLEYLTAPRVPFVREQPLTEEIRRAVEELKEDLLMPVAPVDVGRYDAVIDAHGVANLVAETLGRATELDRALGYEANAGGTSFLNAPATMLGQYRTGADLLTLTANRSEQGGCATVRWDDEGVAPEEFTLVERGVLQDFQTTRESAGWLKASYAKAGRAFRSHGCSAAPQAIDAPIPHTPNLVLQPGSEARDFDALVAELTDGIALRGLGLPGALHLDFQAVSGLGLPSRVYQVKRGKRVALLDMAGILFRAPELWKSLRVLGGPAAARRYGFASAKGEPLQEVYHSVRAVPAAFQQLTLIDPQRKA
jgi:TldD protein